MSVYDDVLKVFNANFYSEEELSSARASLEPVNLGKVISDSYTSIQTLFKAEDLLREGPLIQTFKLSDLVSNEELSVYQSSLDNLSLSNSRDVHLDSLINTVAGGLVLKTNDDLTVISRSHLKNDNIYTRAFNLLTNVNYGFLAGLLTGLVFRDVVYWPLQKVGFNLDIVHNNFDSFFVELNVLAFSAYFILKNNFDKSTNPFSLVADNIAERIRLLEFYQETK